MARPIKQGLDYFPFDVDFFSDEKIATISGEFGIKGEIATIKLLCAVYRNGYFIEWSDMLKFKLLKELPGVSADLLDQIVNRLVKWGFFDKDLFDSALILTSIGIQRRYLAISTKMHRKNSITDFCLISTERPTPPDTPAQMPKRKGRPKSKTQPSAATLAEPKTHDKTPTGFISLDDSISKMLSDTIWNEPVCMRFNLTHEQFAAKIADFRQYCLCMEKHEHESITDAKRHFCSWLGNDKFKKAKPHAASIPDNQPSDFSYKGGFGSKDS